MPSNDQSLTGCIIGQNSGFVIATTDILDLTVYKTFPYDFKVQTAHEHESTDIYQVIFFGCLLRWSITCLLNGKKKESDDVVALRVCLTVFSMSLETYIGSS